MKYIIFLCSITVLIACNSGQNTDDLTLNNGEKWQVNAEMKPFIEDANTILQDYVASNDTDYQTLAKKLKEQNSELINHCTMEGKSHDELHKWLYPHIELIDDLQKATDENASKKIVNQLTASFETYKNYFE